MDELSDRAWHLWTLRNWRPCSNVLVLGLPQGVLALACVEYQCVT